MARPLSITTQRLPEQDINCWIFASILEDILNAVDQDDPFGTELTEWAQAAWETSIINWVFENPTETIHITWPCWPTGRDNERLHQIYDHWRTRYIAEHPEVRHGIQTKTRGTGRPQPETDPQRMSNSNASIALAQASKQKWQTVGRLRKG